MRIPTAHGPTRVLDGALLDALTAEAQSRPRRRVNANLHAMDDRVHRLLNAIEPGSYVRPHRHLHPPKDETVLVVRGALGLVLFEADGGVAETRVLAAGPRRGAIGADLPAGVVHTFVSLESGSVFFEVKEGPYVSPVEEDLPGWAPAEGTPLAASYEESLRRLFPQPPDEDS